MSKITRAFAVLLALPAGACGPDGGEEHVHQSAATPDDYAVEPTEFCAEPPEVAAPVDVDSYVAPVSLIDLGDALIDDGLRVEFHAGSTPPAIDQLKVLADVAEDDSARFIDRTYAAAAVRIQREPVRLRTIDSRTVLSTGGRSFAAVELVVTYTFASTRSGRSFGVSSFELVDASSGRTVDAHHPDLTLVSVPGSCVEQGIVHFGPFPHGMPPVKFPEILGCNEARCALIAEAWLRLHHNVWRANQMFAVLDPMHVEQKKFFWKQPGTDGAGAAVSTRSSPAWWYGDWDGDRYSAIREVMHKYFDIMKTAKTGGIKVRLQCPDSSTNPGNVCFTSDVLGHHWVKGWINFCSDAFTHPGCVANTVSDTIHEVMHHEPLHHVFTHLNGAKALRDTITHFHGPQCLSNPVTQGVICEVDQAGDNAVGVRHFVETGNSCGHLDKVVQSVESHALFIRTIGDMVKNGTMTHWPKFADATPVPPNCYGEVGCLCESTGDWEEPDGDYSIDSFCPDDEGLTVCMKTKFNASDTVGICTLCDEWRGPGCPCNDLTAPCEQGECWGDDTNGNASTTGTCYGEDPPTFACLANCPALLGNGAFCMYDHPDHARCVPYGTTLPEASNCWWNGGHMDPNELSCTTQPECIVTADCHALGYPSYFICDQSLRCVPNP